MKDSVYKKYGIDPCRLPSEAEVALVASCFDVSPNEARTILNARESRISKVGNAEGGQVSGLLGRKTEDIKTRSADDDSVRIRLMAEHDAKPGVIVREMYFEGGYVFRCYRGRFRLTLDGSVSVEIGENETLVIYPDQRVTIAALEEVNLLVYVALEGPGVSAYFDRMGFFNGIHGPTSAQLETFREVKDRLESADQADQAALLLRLSDVFVTYAHDLKVGANALVGRAIHQIRQNLERRIVRLAPLYEQLHVGHTMLNQAFREVGLGSPAEYIRKEQLRLVKRLLTTTRKPIAEIALETGFISVTHFANFVKRNTGHTAREIRRGY